MTIIELLATFALSAIVLVPLFGLVTYVIRQHRPVVESAEASKQLRIFRSVLADDWASARQIVIDPPGHPATNVDCNGAGYGGGPIRIAIVSSYTTPAWIPNPSSGVLEFKNAPLRILYREIANPDGTVKLKRQVCRHITNGGTPAAWELGGRTNEFGYESDTTSSSTIVLGMNRVLLDDVRPLVLPAHACNTNTVAPYPRCDMNVTLVGADADPTATPPFNQSAPYTSSAQRATLRLEQKVGGPLS